jgi:hypothetical protein
VIERAQLGGIGDKLGSGGQAHVYLLPDLQLPDAPGPLVYKEYRDGHAPPHGVRGLVAARSKLPSTERARLDTFATWPLAVVQDGSRACGVVLPLIPDSFFQDRVLPGTGTVHHSLREVQNLFIDAELAERLGMPAPSTRQRLLICRDLAAALHFVHRHRMVVGDINAKNAVFRIDQRPAVMLIDCDAIRIAGSAAVVRQLNAPDWDPPEGMVQSQATDRYKFGLFVLRCLSPGPMASIARDPQRVDHVLDGKARQLLRAALGPAPGRPTAQTWGRHLDLLLTGAPVRQGPEPTTTQPLASALQGPAGPTPTHSIPTRSIPARRRDPDTGRWVPA